MPKLWMDSAEERLLKATKAKTRIESEPRHAISEVRPHVSALIRLPFIIFISKLNFKNKRHADVWQRRVPSTSSSNYPGLSFAVRWHDPGAHAGLANCVSGTGLRMTAASSLSSWLTALLPTSEHTPHLTRGAPWQIGNCSAPPNSEPRAGRY